ncbi:MAG: hypothetical protein AB1546_02990, partial [bacterium]
FWMLKPEIRQRVSQHSEIISILASVGEKQGYDIWIGRREQKEKDLQGKQLSEYMSLSQLVVSNAVNQEVVENIDLLWVKNKKIVSLFEVEATTGMMSALMRGSNVDKEVDKFMILPEERETQLKNKMISPLFREHFENENWKIIYFDALRAAYVKEKANLDIYSLINQKNVSDRSSIKAAKNNQEMLFLPFE